MPSRGVYVGTAVRGASGIVEHGEQRHARLIDDPALGALEMAHLGHDPLEEGAAHGA